MERMSSMDIGSLPDSTWGDIVEQGGLGISFDESPDTVLLTTPGEGGGIAAQLSKRGSTQMRPRNSSLGTSYDAQRPALSTRLCVPPRPFFARLPVYPRSRAPHRISDPRDFHHVLRALSHEGIAQTFLAVALRSFAVSFRCAIALHFCQQGWRRSNGKAVVQDISLRI